MEFFYGTDLSAEQLLAARDAAKLAANDWSSKILLGLVATSGAAFISILTNLATHAFRRSIAYLLLAAAVAFLFAVIASSQSILQNRIIYMARAYELHQMYSAKSFEKQLSKDFPADVRKKLTDSMKDQEEVWRKLWFEREDVRDSGAQWSFRFLSIGLTLTLLAVAFVVLLPNEEGQKHPNLSRRARKLLRHGLRRGSL